MKILIIDPDCPAPYCDATLAAEALGGTEGTIVRVSEALGKRHDVCVAQPPRSDPYGSGNGVRYVGFDCKHVRRTSGFEAVREVMDNPDVVILVRAYKLLKRIRRAYPRSRLFLWLHCFPGKSRKDINTLAVEHQATIVTVSDTHRRFVADFIDRYQTRETVHTPEERAPIRRIYNPISDDLRPDDTAVDPDKLVYFSSPHKGLEQVVEAFAAVRHRRPSTTLWVANPGYIPLAERFGADGIEVLGALPHSEVLKHVREAFCVFYPQYRFEETFGLIFAEANAVGTPVIAHPIGSAREMLRDDRQLVDARDPENVCDRLMQWYDQGRPQVDVRPEFRLSNVVSAWEELIRETAPPRIVEERGDGRMAVAA